MRTIHKHVLERQQILNQLAAAQKQRDIAARTCAKLVLLGCTDAAMDQARLYEARDKRIGLFLAALASLEDDES